MYCQSCGTQVVPDQQFCSKCSMPLTGYVFEQKSRLRRHLHLLGIFWIAYSAFSLLRGLAVLIVANTIFGPFGPVQGEARLFIRPLLTAVGGFLLVKAFAGIAAGWGLSQHLEWARTLTAVLGFVALIDVPFGTVVGIYTIWALLSPGADDEYEAMSRGAAA